MNKGWRCSQGAPQQQTDSDNGLWSEKGSVGAPRASVKVKDLSSKH